MVVGVSQGFGKSLEIVGVGYRVAMQGSKLVFNLGKSHQDILDIPQGIDVKVKLTKYLHLKAELLKIH